MIISLKFVVDVDIRKDKKVQTRICVFFKLFKSVVSVKAKNAKTVNLVYRVKLSLKNIQKKNKKSCFNMS